MEKEKNDELLTFTVDDIDMFRIDCKKAGKIGFIVYRATFELWCFFPIENFYYKPIHLALILKKINELNNYKKGDKDD